MRAHALLFVALLAACDDESPSASPATDAGAPSQDAAPADASVELDSAPPDAAPEPESTATVLMNLGFDRADPAAFFDFPYPSDLRLTASGGPDLADMPGPRGLPLVDGLRQIVGDRPGFPTVPVAWFRLTEPTTPRRPDAVIPADPSSPLLLLDVDPDSPERGRLYPVVAHTLPPDDYAPEHLLAVSAVPGFVLVPGRLHAFVVRTSLGDAQGLPLRPADGLAAVEPGVDSEAGALYAPLWDALEGAGVPFAEVAAATVFTPGDVVAETWALTETVRAAYAPEIEDLAIDPDDGADHDRYCELHGRLTLPQFQKGEPPFDTEGNFEFEDGAPVAWRSETIPVVITIPRTEMPPDGHPLVMYFHGSGGYSEQLVDRGRQPPRGSPRAGEGPAFVVARHGFAMAGSAHPVNPERVPGATSIEYLNLLNLKAFRDTFRQGVIEQRLYLDALLRLRIPPETLAGCDGASLPDGADAWFFRPDPVLAMGQSMGGMYTNLIGAVEPRIRAVVPTGAGGFWSHFILVTSLIPNLDVLLPTVLRSSPGLSYMHPALHLLQTAWEPAEPMVYMPRLARRPLPGHPVRPIYEPIGKDDSYFPTELYDAIVLAYGHPMAGDEVWPSMQDRLALAGLDGLVPYPVRDNLTSERGTDYTGVAVQYEGDGFSDPHVIFVQLDAVKHQYGCFFESLLRDGAATVPAPAELGTPCE